MKGQAAIPYCLVMIGLLFLALVAYAIYTETIGNVSSAVSAIALNEHALKQHGEDAVAANNCLSNEGNILIRLFSPTTKRFCSIGRAESNIYLGITEQNGETVTMFQWKKLELKLVQYLRNRGYLP
jgi:hypothetical protein